ncbi:hypothetical protein ACFFOM_04660 [Microlunatus capsulatus]|uniref:Uncharacterized protein n=1 Tax=Microlunatus capsulatus TaxID=99117 RepID=A0ABS4Z4P9_9ACTN|nr:hypothetical protein [Microlunatus capsulatus]MBP2416005.1 hypothetical protein [Microlunatus capsulatus]
MTTATALYADPHAPAPTLSPVGVPERPDDRARFVTRVRVAATVPLVIGLGTHVLFLVAYWIPETSAFPAHDWWLGQLSPLVSEALTSDGEAQVEAQWRQPGLGGLLLLLAAVALFVLDRRPRLLGPGAAVLPAAVGTLVALVTAVALVLGGRPSASGLTLVLLALWVGTAGYAALAGLLVDTEAYRERRWRHGVVLLAAYAVVGPVPTAVGRALFGPQLRDAAAALQGNTVALRLAALTNGTTLLLYLSGLLVGVAVWGAYQCWPPRRDLRTGLRVLVLVGALVLTALVGSAAAGPAERRAEQLRQDSPADAIRFSCGAASLDGSGPGAPARTLVITGFTCTTLTTYEGYRQQVTRELPFSLAPVTVRDPDGRRLPGRVVSAQYGPTLVLVGSSRVDTGADELLAVAVDDGRELWRSSCPDRRPLRLRFTGVPGGDDPQHGRLAAGPAAVVVTCAGRTTRLDPDTGAPRR